MHLTLFDPGGLIALAQVLMIDVVLAGDNAVVIGLAAARVPVVIRRKVIFWGLVAAVVLRIAMAVVAVKLLAVIGLTLAGGILLLWVCWRMWRDIAGDKHHDAPKIEAGASARRAILQILVADYRKKQNALQLELENPPENFALRLSSLRSLTLRLCLSLFAIVFLSSAIQCKAAPIVHEYESPQLH